MVVPSGEGGRTRNFATTKPRIWVLGVFLFFGIVIGTILAVLYTPLGYYLPIRNSQIEQRYGKEILATKERVNALAGELLTLKDYNNQLKKALGDRGDSLAMREPPPSVMASENVVDSAEAIVTSGLEMAGDEPQAEGDFTIAPDSYYNAVVTNGEGFRASFPLVAPSDGIQTQGFDPSRNHFGIDYAVKRGTPVHAATDGYVVFSGWTYDDGNMMTIAHGGGYLTVYKHNSVLLKSPHTFVRRGEAIALSGDTGKRSEGPHLHFEVWKDGLTVDPKEFLLAASSIQ